MHLEPTLRGQGSSMLGAPMAQGSHLPLAPRSGSVTAATQSRNRSLGAFLKDFRILGITKLGPPVILEAS